MFSSTNKNICEGSITVMSKKLVLIYL